MKRPILIPVDPENHIYALRIDNTTLSTHTSCNRAGQYYAITRRQATPKAALAFGNAIHVGLEHFYKGLDINSCCQKILDALVDYSPDESEWRTPTLAVETMLAYAKHYHLAQDFVPHRRTDGSLAVEIPFSLPLGEFPINAHFPMPRSFYTGENIPDEPPHPYVSTLQVYWTGKIDLIDNPIGDAFVVDHKTSSIGGSQFFSDFELSHQMIGYNWAARQLFPELNIRGTVINALIQRKPTRTGTAREFSRVTHFVSDWHVEEWKRDMGLLIRSFLTNLIQSYFPRNTSHCFGKYGRCPYHDVCTLPPNQRSIMLSTSSYTDVVWSPLG